MFLVRRRFALRGWGLLFAFTALGAGLPASAGADPGDALDTAGGGIAVRFVVHAADAMAHGRLTEAMALCNRALAQFPNYMRARFERGAAEMAASDYAAAMSDFDAFIAAHPEYPLAYVYRGITYLRQHRPEMAIVEMNKAMTAKTGINSFWAADVFIYRGLAFEQLGRSDDAIADFTSAMKFTGGNTDDWSIFSFGCYNAAVAGLLETAALDCDESISRQSRNPAAYWARGYIDFRRGQFGQAEADYTKALYYQNDNTYALYGRGAAKHALGDRVGGDTDIATATASEPHIGDIMARVGVNANPAAGAK